MRSDLERGFSLLSVLLALAVVGVLYFAVLGPSRAVEEVQPPMQDLRAAQAAGQETACQRNRSEIQRSLLTWTVTHPGQTPTLEALRRSGFHVPPCPSGGLLEISGQKMVCSRHPER